MRFRVPLTDEALEVLRRAFTGEKFSFEGKRYNFQDVKITPGFVQPGDPPLWVAASGRNAGDFRIGIIRSCLVTDDPARDWVDVRAAERRRMEVYNRFREAAGGHGGVAASPRRSVSRRPGWSATWTIASPNCRRSSASTA